MSRGVSSAKGEAANSNSDGADRVIAIRAASKALYIRAYHPTEVNTSRIGAVFADKITCFLLAFVSLKKCFASAISFSLSIYQWAEKALLTDRLVRPVGTDVSQFWQRGSARILTTGESGSRFMRQIFKNNHVKLFALQAPTLSLIHLARAAPYRNKNNAYFVLLSDSTILCKACNIVGSSVSLSGYSRCGHPR